MYERRACLTFFLLGFVFDDIFGPNKDYLFCLVFVALYFCRHMSNAICDLVVYLKSDGLNISWIYWYISILALKNGIRNTRFYPVASWKSLYFSNVRSIDRRSRMFWSFEVWFLIFSIKEEIMRNIHNQNVA